MYASQLDHRIVDINSSVSITTFKHNIRSRKLAGQFHDIRVISNKLILTRIQRGSQGSKNIGTNIGNSSAGDMHIRRRTRSACIGSRQNHCPSA